MKAAEIFTKYSKVLTSQILLALKADGEILQHNGSQNEDADKQAEVLIEGYGFLNHNITQARAKQMSQIRGALKGKWNSEFGC